MFYPSLDLQGSLCWSFSRMSRVFSFDERCSLFLSQHMIGCGACDEVIMHEEVLLGSTFLCGGRSWLFFYKFSACKVFVVVEVQ